MTAVEILTCVIAGGNIVVDVVVSMYGECSTMAGVDVVYVF